MKLHNYMENTVFHVLNNLLLKRNDICTCEKCRMDIAAIALNNLPTRYVVTEKGELYTKLNEMEIQFEADIIKELVRAIEKVSRATKHDVE
ncbi:MAG: competence protein ComFB [Firmicutes bacterium]|nr:competence protein ComFB [Bacillota bacterium]